MTIGLSHEEYQADIDDAVREERTRLVALLRAPAAREHLIDVFLDRSQATVDAQAKDVIDAVIALINSGAGGSKSEQRRITVQRKKS